MNSGDHSAARLLCPWDFPANTRMAYHSLLWGIFLAKALNPSSVGLMHWQVGSLTKSPRKPIQEHPCAPFRNLCAFSPRELPVTLDRSMDQESTINKATGKTLWNLNRPHRRLLQLVFGTFFLSGNFFF